MFYSSCRVEGLESRTLFSMSFDPATADALHAAEARGGNIVGPAIRLDIVALHELGHSFGLGHTSDPSSIMYAYYNAGYDLTKFASDSAVATFRSLFSSESTRAWKDALDADGGVSDGDVDLTYSFVLDGARMDQGGKSNTFSALNQRFGAGNWQSIFVQELQRWAGVSNGTLQARPLDADGVENAVYAFNASGLSQNDPRMGDIRFATHKMDGPGNVLGHTYFPPPNGSTAAGDSHYDSAENWVLASGSLTSSAEVQASLAGTSPTGLRLGQSIFSDRLLGDGDLLSDGAVEVL